MSNDPAEALEHAHHATHPRHGPNSAFALAGADRTDAPIDAPQEPTEADWMNRARKTFDACRELSCVQLQEALGSTRSRATGIIKELIEARQIVQLRKDGVVPIYGAPTGGFKGWLERKALQPAAAKAPRKSKPRRPKASPASSRPGGGSTAQRALTRVSRPTASPALPAEVFPMPAPRDELDLGFFTSGEIEIKAGGQSIRLDAQRARKLIDWALRVDALLSPGGV